MERSVRHEFLTNGLVIPICLLFAAGCGEAPDTIPEGNVATVHGVVKVRGKPVTRGLIRFEASNNGKSSRLESAPIGPDGSYSATTLIGPNTVTFVFPSSGKADPAPDSKVNFEAKPGDNPFDIDLPPN
jgi:hypothetical protein